MHRDDGKSDLGCHGIPWSNGTNQTSRQQLWPLGSHQLWWSQRWHHLWLKQNFVIFSWLRNNRDVRGNWYRYCYSSLKKLGFREALSVTPFKLRAWCLSVLYNVGDKHTLNFIDLCAILWEKIKVLRSDICSLPLQKCDVSLSWQNK